MGGNAALQHEEFEAPVTSRMAATRGRRLATDRETLATRYVDAVIEQFNLPDTHPDRKVAHRIGMAIRTADRGEILQFVGGPDGDEAFRLDAGFVGVVQSLGLERFYAFTGNDSWPACHIASDDLIGFIRDQRPELVSMPVAAPRP